MAALADGVCGMDAPVSGCARTQAVLQSLGRCARTGHCYGYWVSALAYNLISLHVLILFREVYD